MAKLMQVGSDLVPYKIFQKFKSWWSGVFKKEAGITVYENKFVDHSVGAGGADLLLVSRS